MTSLAYAPLVALLAAASDLGGSQPLQQSPAIPEKVLSLYSQTSIARGSADFRERILAFSEQFLGVRYQFDPLGEGQGIPPDEDPRIRFEPVDCQTYVETILALARSRNPGSLLQILDDIRYDGAVSYVRRNHFFEAHWTSANLRKGYVRDITAAVGGKDAITHVKEVTNSQWNQRAFAKQIDLPEDRIPVGRYKLAYIPLAKINAHARQIPSGTIFAVVRKDRPLSPTMVSHLGFLIQSEEGLKARHASTKGVADQDIDSFIAQNAGFKSWPVLGLQLFEPLDAKKTQ